MAFNEQGVEGMDTRCYEKITSDKIPEPEEIFSTPLSYIIREQLYIQKESKHERNPWMTDEELEHHFDERLKNLKQKRKSYALGSAVATDGYMVIEEEPAVLDAQIVISSTKSMATFKLYHRSTIGMNLTDTLDEMGSTTNVVSMAEALDNKVKTKVSIKISGVDEKVPKIKKAIFLFLDYPFSEQAVVAEFLEKAFDFVAKETHPVVKDVNGLVKEKSNGAGG
nr:transcription initiation factor IIA subunit 2 [Tanacetum cinerariifolium]